MSDLWLHKRVFYGLSLLILCCAFLLRFLGWQHSPPSPYWEEVALGYDAYSIALTGKDHHGNAWPLVAFESFGDWKPSLYFYTVAPFIRLFGLSVEIVRLPSLLAGMMAVLGTAFLAYLVVEGIPNIKKYRQAVFLLTLFLIAFSPWAITFSRAAWESNLAMTLIVWGSNALFLAIRSERIQRKSFGWLILATVFLVLASYCYHSARLTAPIIGVCGIGLYLWQSPSRRNFLRLIPIALFAFVAMLPLLLSLQSNVGQQRFAETSIFSDISIIEKSNERIAAAGNTWWSHLLYHRYRYFGEKIAANFFSHFSARYLFISGDPNPRHSIQLVGEFYWIDSLLLVGIAWLLLRHWHRHFLLPLTLVIFGILPAAFTTATPHALRTLAALPGFMALMGITGVVFLKQIHQKPWRYSLVVLFVLITLIKTSYFFQVLTTSYPVKTAAEWQYGYQEMINSINQLHETEKSIYVTREYGRPAMYYWFYSKTDPTRVQAENRTVKKDQGEFLSYRNVQFINSSSEVQAAPGVIVAASPQQIQQLQQKTSQPNETVTTIMDPSNKPIWQIIRFVQ